MLAVQSYAYDSHQHAEHDAGEERKTASVAGQTVAYVESTVADIEVANRLAHAVLGQSLDELAGSRSRAASHARCRHAAEQHFGTGPAPSPSPAARTTHTPTPDQPPRRPPMLVPFS
ncbi:MAG: hypothetical protein ACK5MT_07505 [Actinomycetales bacterium]